MSKLTFAQCQAIGRFCIGNILYEYHSSLITAPSISTPTHYSWDRAVDFFASRLFHLTKDGADIAAQKTTLENLVSHSTNYIWILDLFTRSIFQLGHGWSSLPYNQYHVIGFLTTAIDNLSLLESPVVGGSSGGGSIDIEAMSETIAQALAIVLDPIIVTINSENLEF